MAAKHLLSRARLLLTRHRSRPTILPPALTRLLFGGTTTPADPDDDKAKARAAAAAAAAVALDAKRAKREGSDDDDEGAGLPWTSWRPDVAWLTKALEPALQLYKHYNWKPFACKPATLFSPPLLCFLRFPCCSALVEYIPISIAVRDAGIMILGNRNNPDPLAVPDTGGATGCVLPPGQGNPGEAPNGVANPQAHPSRHRTTMAAGSR